MYVLTYVCIYVCMYVCMYKHVIFIYLLPVCINSGIFRALEDLHTFQNGRCSHLIDVLFNASPPSPSHPKWDNLIGQLVHDIPPKSWEPDQEDSPAPEEKTVFHNFSFLNHSLDKSQQTAVLFALSRPDVAIIHGPPGTGKTTTVVEFIMQCTKMKQKV